jgi:hypothetical protein
MKALSLAPEHAEFADGTRWDAPTRATSGTKCVIYYGLFGR